MGKLAIKDDLKPDWTCPLLRLVRIEDISEGEERLIETDVKECNVIASLLDLVSLERLALSFRLHRSTHSRVDLTGRLVAAATQTCVISLEPLPVTLDIPVAMEFWPSARLAALEAESETRETHDILDWPEPIVNGEIDLGRVLYEAFATSLDPYPRKEGASFDWTEDARRETVETASSPFAALRQLRSS